MKSEAGSLTSFHLFSVATPHHCIDTPPHHRTTAPLHLLISIIFLSVMMFQFQATGSILITAGPGETIKLVAAGIQAGDATEVSKFFNVMVDLILPGYNDTYAKNQAGQILKEFFYQNPVKSFKVTKQGSSANGSQYAIGELKSGNKDFRVYFLIQTVDGQNLIQQLKIEEKHYTIVLPRNCLRNQDEPSKTTMTLDQIIVNALAEDLGDGDHSSLATIAQESEGKARLILKDEGILCGMIVAEKIYALTDPGINMTVFLHDGDQVKKGDIAFDVSGKARSILATERLVLNFMQRLSGIATTTNHLVNLVKDLHARIIDTRKTTPNLRELEKYAVRTGGGENHRMGLYDMIMIKDNHVDFAGGIVHAIESVHDYLKRTGKKLKIEIEVRNFPELEQVIKNGKVDRIMLDNFTPDNLKKAISVIDGRFETEASGGINEKNIRLYAETGVDFISIGALTHQIKSLDMSLKAVGSRQLMSDR